MRHAVTFRPVSTEVPALNGERGALAIMLLPVLKVHITIPVDSGISFEFLRHGNSAILNQFLVRRDIAAIREHVSGGQVVFDQLLHPQCLTLAVVGRLTRQRLIPVSIHAFRIDHRHPLSRLSVVGRRHKFAIGRDVTGLARRFRVVVDVLDQVPRRAVDRARVAGDFEHRPVNAGLAAIVVLAGGSFEICIRVKPNFPDGRDHRSFRHPAVASAARTEGWATGTRTAAATGTSTRTTGRRGVGPGQGDGVILREAAERFAVHVTKGRADLDGRRARGDVGNLWVGAKTVGGRVAIRHQATETAGLFGRGQPAAVS